MNILVTGATGTVGSLVVRALGERGVAARAFVRDPGKAVRVLGEDAELAVGDFADLRTVARAMRGIDRVFLACGNVPGQVEHECAVIDAARAAGVERIVKLSSPRADAGSPLLVERWHGGIESYLGRSGVPSAVLHPRTYMTNLLADAATIRHTGRLFAPAGQATITFVDPHDVAEAAAAVLTGEGHTGRAYALSGPQALTFGEIAEQLSAAAGSSIEYVDVPDEAAVSAMQAAGLPGPVAESVVGFFAALRAGALAEPTDAVRVLTGREPRTFAQFAREHAEAFRPSTVIMHASATTG